MNSEEILSRLENFFLRYLGELYILESFYSDKEAMGLLSKVAESTFAHMQRSLMDSAVMIVCRAYDKARTFGFDNLTLYQLAECLPTKQAEAEAMLATQIATMEDIRKLRNKVIGHTSLDHHRSGTAVQYIGASHDEMVQYAQFFGDVLRLASQDIRGHEVTYSGAILDEGNPEQFLDFIRMNLAK
jgi:hypothetical protein